MSSWWVALGFFGIWKFLFLWIWSSPHHFIKYLCFLSLCFWGTPIIQQSIWLTAYQRSRELSYSLFILSVLIIVPYLVKSIANFLFQLSHHTFFSFQNVILFFFIYGVHSFANLILFSWCCPDVYLRPFAAHQASLGQLCGADCQQVRDCHACWSHPVSHIVHTLMDLLLSQGLWNEMHFIHSLELLLGNKRHESWLVARSHGLAGC